MMNRLFIALKLPPGAIDLITGERDRIYGGREFRWEDDSKLHLTLKFLGDVDERNNEQIINILEMICRGRGGQSLRPERFSFLVKFREPKILWLELKADEGLSEIIAELENRLEKIGFQKETRSFKPHVTLSRIKNPVCRETLDLFRQYRFEETEFLCGEIALVKSDLRPGGSVYKDIKVFKLDKGE